MAAEAPAFTPKFIPVELDENPAESRSFRIVSYNILAQVYVKSSLFPHSPPSCLKWKARSQSVLSRLLSFDADLLCLQELDEFESFYKPHLESIGYSSIYIQRSGKKRDGCGIFFKHASCEMLDSEIIDYNDLVPSEESPPLGAEDEDSRDVNDPRIRLKRNCVGVMAAYKISNAPEKVIVVANTHLYWDPNLEDVKMAQAKYLISRVKEFDRKIKEKLQCTSVIVIAGDFNSTPGDKVYNYLISSELQSLYATVKKKEPCFTNCTPGFTGTLDYIFVNPWKELVAKSVLELPLSEDEEEVLGGLPNHYHPSDHLPIGADFAFC